VFHLFCWICFWLLCVEKKREKTKQNKTKQNLHTLLPAQAAHPPPFFSFSPRGLTISSQPTKFRGPLHPSRPAYLPLSHSLTDGRGPPVSVAFNLQPPASLSWPRPAADPGCLFPLPRLLPFPSSAPCTQPAPPNPSPSSSPRNGCAPSHQAINGGPPVCRSTASAASPLLPSLPIKAAPRAYLQPALLTRAPPLLYTAAPRRPNRSSAPRRRSPPPALLLPLRAAR
jgi:hypothetical protein